MATKDQAAVLPAATHRRVLQQNNSKLQQMRQVHRRVSGQDKTQLHRKVTEQEKMLQRYRQHIQRLTISSGAFDSPFVADATPFFDRCETELMSLHYGGRMGLLDLFNWSSSDEFTKTFKYITYVRPAYNEGTPTVGYQSDPCADPNGVEFGAAEITLSGFGRYGRMGPSRDILKPERYCVTDPRYRLDGNLVTSEFEWDLAFIMDAMMQDLFRAIITGNDSTPGQFDGIQQWINTGYASSILDSMVFEWAGNSFDGTGGGTKTLNGEAIPASAGIINVLLSVYRRYKQRIKWSPMLATQTLRTGQVVLVLPQFLAECLLDAFTCWSVCPGRQYNEANLNTLEARTFRDGLNGGMFGGGTITLDGDDIPLYIYDWETQHGSQRGDMYFMTMGVGNVRLWEGEYLDAGAAAAEMRSEGHSEYFSTDGGRVIGVTEVDNLCRTTKAWIRPRIICRAPWLQSRIMDVECATILDPLSPDPLDTSFYPVTSFGADAQTTG